MKVHDVMHPGASWIAPGALLPNIAARMVGMLSLGDVAAKASASISAETLRAVSGHHA